MKYVIFAGDNFLILPDFMNHADVKDVGIPISAGFCSVSQCRDQYGDERFNMNCWGESISLKLKSREDDKLIIARGLRN